MSRSPDAYLTVPPTFLLISGSLRQASTNTALLRTAARIAPTGIDCRLYCGMAKLPAFNPDDDVHRLHPEVGRLRHTIHQADAIIFSTPEYAGALPGALKNLLDWTIGDEQAGSIYDKPVCWVNASLRGADGAHAELRTVLGYAHARIVDAACAADSCHPDHDRPRRSCHRRHGTRQAGTGSWRTCRRSGRGAPPGLGLAPAPGDIAHEPGTPTGFGQTCFVRRDCQACRR